MEEASHYPTKTTTVKKPLDYNKVATRKGPSINNYV